MCRWLLMYEPPESVVGKVADAYLATGGDIKEMIRTTLSLENVELASQFDHLKLRRPYHYAVGLMRSVFAKCTAPSPIVAEVRGMGQFPFDRVTPDGYPDDLDTWGSAMMPRWAFATKLLEDAFDGTSIDRSRLDPYLDVPRDELAPAIDRLLTGGVMAPDDVADLQSFIDSFGSVPYSVKAQALGLAASCSSYQFY
jgi:hypothetical protein